MSRAPRHRADLGRALVWLVLACAFTSCRKATDVPEEGALFLRLSLAPETTVPDELRMSVFDDGATLWQEARVPAQGALPAPQGNTLGTFLIQPGDAAGALRVDVRALAAGQPVAEGALVVPSGQRGTFDLVLHAGLMPDRDGDGVPDDLDDCADTPNPAQGGCPDTTAADASIAGDGGADALAEAGAGGGGDAASIDIPVRDAATWDESPGDAERPGEVDAGCAASGTCPLSVGMACTSNGRCASGQCVDGVCCSTSCNGPCRSCNVPGQIGTCAPYAAGSDPERECLPSFTCNGSGSCTVTISTPRPNGTACTATKDCASGFCKDGVCCNNACAGPCQSCSTGTCKAVTRGQDIPECVAPSQCNESGRCSGK